MRSVPRVEVRVLDERVRAWGLPQYHSEMAAGVDAPKTRPEDVAKLVLSRVEAGEQEVLADEVSRSLKRGLSAEPGVYLGGANH